MIFIDGAGMAAFSHGTGTEDYFNTAYCPAAQVRRALSRHHPPGGPNWSGKISLYRFHIEDPIHFQKSIRVTIEHGHANRRSDDYSSTAYWYQIEPHAPFPAPLQYRNDCRARLGFVPSPQPNQPLERQGANTRPAFRFLSRYNGSPASLSFIRPPRRNFDATKFE